VVVVDFNNPLSPIDRSSKRKINKEVLELNHTIDQMDLIDVYRIFHLTSAQYTFFSAARGTFSKIDHILGHKASLSKYKKIEIISCILSEHNALKLEINNKTAVKNTQTIGSWTTHYSMMNWSLMK
jgi:exonuclease III